MRTQTLFDRYYYSKLGFVDGTEIFHGICKKQLASGRHILELGAGPANTTTAFLATLGTVVGLDVSNEVLANPDLAKAYVYDGNTMPFPSESFDMCVSNYVLEHVTEPRAHFSEIYRILRPGGAYCFRTPNRWHYVTIASSALPYSVHLRLANKLRALDRGTHDPWPTVYRANSRGRLTDLARVTGFVPQQIAMIETEPSYGAAHWLLFYPMMVYERVVNSTELLRRLRVNILGAFRKPRWPFSHHSEHEYDP
jgi:SAM-dependent methyltransferase